MYPGHKRCVSCLHNSASGYMIMQAPWGSGNYIKMHSFISKFVSNILEALMHYQLVILYSNYHWLIFFVPLLLLNYLKKHKMAPSLWLIKKTNSQRIQELKETMPFQHNHSSAVSISIFSLEIQTFFFSVQGWNPQGGNYVQGITKLSIYFWSPKKFSSY